LAACPPAFMPDPSPQGRGKSRWRRLVKPGLPMTSSTGEWVSLPTNPLVVGADVRRLKLVPWRDGYDIRASLRRLLRGSGVARRETSFRGNLSPRERLPITPRSLFRLKAGQRTGVFVVPALAGTRGFRKTPRPLFRLKAGQRTTSLDVLALFVVPALAGT